MRVEAAQVDGVNPVRVFVRVTLPLIRPALLVAGASLDRLGLTALRRGVGGPTVEKVAGACCSTGMVYAMHVCATATIAAGAEPGSGPLAETLQAPVVDQGGRMNFPTRHPLNLSDNGRQLAAPSPRWSTRALAST